MIDKIVILNDIRDNNLKINEELEWLNKMLAKAETRASIAMQEVEQYKIVTVSYTHLTLPTKRIV